MHRLSNCWTSGQTKMPGVAFFWMCGWPGLSGPELQSRLTELGWTLPIVFLTGHPDISTTVKAIKAGADNFLIKPVSSDELLRAIETAIARHETERALKSELEALRARLSTLTPRQRQVFEIIVRGKTNKHAARELGGSVANDQGAIGK